MAAVVSKTASIGSRVESWESKLLSLRLPQSDVDDLRFVFGGLESMVGLRSRFGEQITILAASAATACEHSPTRDPCCYCRQRYACQHCGKCTRCGAQTFEHMYVGSSTHGESAHDPLQPLALEAWCCWRNQKAVDYKPPPLGARARETRDALVVMVDRGHTGDVVTLWRMYGASTPRERLEHFKSLGDLVPLATETDAVQAHAERLTKRLREEHETELFEQAVKLGRRGSKTFEDLPRHIAASKLTVTPMEALHDLLDSVHGEAKDRRLERAEHVGKVKRQAHTMLVEASHAYRRAKGR